GRVLSPADKEATTRVTTWQEVRSAFAGRDGQQHDETQPRRCPPRQKPQGASGRANAADHHAQPQPLMWRGRGLRQSRSDPIYFRRGGPRMRGRLIAAGNFDSMHPMSTVATLDRWIAREAIGFAIDSPRSFDPIVAAMGDSVEVL